MADEFLRLKDGSLDIRGIYDSCTIAASDIQKELGKPPLGMILINGSAVTACLRLIRSLDSRIAEMEAKKSIEYRGIWSSSEYYCKGDFVTWGGSMWHANTNTRSKPGTDATWRMAVKSGKDAKP